MKIPTLEKRGWGTRLRMSEAEEEASACFGRNDRAGWMVESEWQDQMNGERTEVLEDGLDVGVEGDVGDTFTVNGEGHAICFGEMEEAADVVVLVVTGK
jgi:hypothetical protein